MSWGVATQNGVSVSLASIVSLSCGATEFSPASLFTSGVAGAWYDPSDYSTLFQDSAGTTPVTAVEQPVRLMLDKSQGLVLGSELITNGDFSSGLTGWTNGSTGTGSATAPSGAAVLIGIDSSNAARISQGSTVAGKTYKVTFDLTMTSGTAVVEIGGTFRLFTTSGSRSYYEVATNTSGYVIRTPGGGGNFTIDNVSVKELPGNHATAPNDLSRPVLRARYNQLTYSEQFSNAAWNIQTNLAFTTGVTDPNGASTATTLRANGGAGRLLQSATATNSVQYTASIWIRRRTGTGDINWEAVGVGVGPLINVTTAWQRVTYTATVLGGGIFYYGIRIATAGDEVDIWGADLRTGSSAGTYQRIAAATDYATAGFLPYLYFVTDDSFGTNSIDFSATDKMSVCAGLTKLSDASIGTVIESSASAGANNGTFAIYAPNSPNQYTARSAGTATGDVNITSGYAAPVTNVLTMLGDISGDSNKLRINGTQVGQSTVDEGTGNYLAYPLYIGRRNNSSFPFNGNLYGLIVCGKMLSASELSATESWMNARTGAY